MDLGREALKEDVCKCNIHGDDIGLCFFCKGIHGAGGGAFILISACGEIRDVWHCWGEGAKAAG